MSPYQIKSMAGKPYRPSNGTEGADFEYQWCRRCVHDADFQRTGPGGDGCPIFFLVLLHDIGEPEYPCHWTHNAEGEPVCTAFEEVKP